ncbi:hypothetical protein NEUTE1DRAFT_121265 [Neurospora tetrasperma FGSC 2508]|uniref:Uncharacterized protein n=1 Tax=Neurospora tetrasperma (strain FGSC 2508 / ATCC MYA-4615 / P0657) TaxID=510951 RepID=F8MGJ2_NEUT8|nr:uncharacterized protein NEUTE1DRAFT_121265 [Neurospora tetrasperma FGSC 2508]EGO59464.1 hypothetical protein NEUTE1DRAFT_121265 [Neurospora tetrasperma FGSC 2508]EGZ73589.1 hypothetical protein NEUTE2DRAFT_149615 [Neurospora tetrasperma FGSC 2509]
MDAKKQAPSLLDDDSFSLTSFITGYTSSTTRTLSSYHPSQHQIGGDSQSLYQPYGVHASPFHPILDPSLVPPQQQQPQPQPQPQQPEHQHTYQQHREELSCVTQETLRQDCAQARFIIWAAVNRNLCPTLKDEERSKCPLHKCQLLLSDHESMLKHLVNCRYLSTGEYWCPQHNRVERFDDVKCKRCLSHPSKRRKMLFMAKKFFHGLGHKSKRSQDSGFDVDHDSSAPPPYEFLSAASVDQPIMMQTQPTELESVMRYEIDSVEVSTIYNNPETGLEAGVDPQALMVPAPSMVLTSSQTLPGIPETSEGISELECTEPSHPLLSSYQSFMGMNWEGSGASHSASPFPCTLPDDASGRSSQSRPSLQVNTQGLAGRRLPQRHNSRPAVVPSRRHGLSPQSSVRSNASADTIFTTMSSTLVSPVTDYSEGLSSDVAWSVNHTKMTDEFNEVVETFYNAPFPNILDGPAELPAEIHVPQMPDDLLFPLEMPSADSTYPAQLDLTADDPMDIVEPEQIEVHNDNICNPEVETMIMSAWDLIQEHLSASRQAIQDIPDNHLANKLRTMPCKEIALTGLQTLQQMLQGEQPSSSMDFLCLIHVIYAFNFVTRQEHMEHDAKGLFFQSLAYENLLQAEEGTVYRQLVYHILEPSGITPGDLGNFRAKSSVVPLSRSSSLKGKAPTTRIDISSTHSDTLLVAGCRFLDELESCIVFGQPSHSLDINKSELHRKHQEVLMFSRNHGFSSDVTKMLCELVKYNEDLQLLKGKLSEICNKVNNGVIFSGRRLEIEVLHAGKESMPASRYHSDYVPKVWELCDEIYLKYFGSVNDRAVYHQLGISVIQSVISGFDIPQNHSTVTTTEENQDELARFLKDHTDIGKVPMEAYRKFSVPTMTLTPPEALHSSHVASLTATFGPQQPQQSQQPQQTRQQQQQQQQKQASHLGEIPSEDQAPASTTDQTQKPDSDPQHPPQCHLCDYRPDGNPRWFKGSMAKHMKVKHSDQPDKIYPCKFPGCKSKYKNRPDNLRQHMIEKGHWVEGEGGWNSRSGSTKSERRPSKKRKKGDDFVVGSDGN